MLPVQDCSRACAQLPGTQLSLKIRSSTCLPVRYNKIGIASACIKKSQTESALYSMTSGSHPSTLFLDSRTEWLRWPTELQSGTPYCLLQSLCESLRCLDPLSQVTKGVPGLPSFTPAGTPNYR